MTDPNAPALDPMSPRWSGAPMAGAGASPSLTGRIGSGLRQLARNRMALIGLIVLLIAILAAIAAPLIAPYDPKKIAVIDALQGPTRSHVMGTDNLGRDLFSRVLYGIRMSVLVAAVSIAVAGIVGITLGLLAGFYGKRVDEVIMRAMDILYAFPDLLLALALVATFGTGLPSLIVAIAIGRIPGFARITRASVLSVRENEYVEAARTIGMGNGRILIRHILPNGLAPIIVMASASLALAILVEASLSFLGLGIQPPTPSLGGLLKDALGFMETAPWMAIFPGITIALLIFALNMLGDGLRDVLDPKLK
ncbi:MAG: ABC transporter permease [Thermomicrobiales bacterium]|nr:ABC transporter permease [Thermomicrobiales bacterium]